MKLTTIHDTKHNEPCMKNRHGIVGDLCGPTITRLKKHTEKITVATNKGKINTVDGQGFFLQKMYIYLIKNVVLSVSQRIYYGLYLTMLKSQLPYIDIYNYTCSKTPLAF